ncbi:MAG TPA: hypothetical protein VGC15_17765 [Acetobacteraceae bacterium]
MAVPNTTKPPRQRQRPTPAKGNEGHDTATLRIAEGMGLLTGPKTRHFNAKVPPALFEAAARRIGATSPAAVITAALASLATEDELGPWLARNWGILADTSPELMEQLDL